MKIYIIITTTSTDGAVEVETFKDRKIAETTLRHYFTTCITGFNVESANYTINDYKVVYFNGDWINMHLFETEVA